MCNAGLAVLGFSWCSQGMNQALFLAADCPGTFLAACSNFSYAFFELRQDVFLWLFISPTHTPLEKGELLHISPLILGAEIFMLLVHLSPQTNPCLPASSHPTCQGKGRAVSAGGSKPKFHKGAGMDRVNSFISDSEALANQAIPDCRKTGSRLPSAPSPAPVLQA